MALLFPFQPRISFRSIERLENIYILLTDILQRKKRIPYKGLFSPPPTTQRNFVMPAAAA